jgi:hypothetical protein
VRLTPYIDSIINACILLLIYGLFNYSSNYITLNDRMIKIRTRDLPNIKQECYPEDGNGVDKLFFCMLDSYANRCESGVKKI